jgi:hypothetical protein
MRIPMGRRMILCWGLCKPPIMSIRFEDPAVEVGGDPTGAGIRRSAGAAALQPAALDNETEEKT